MAKSISLGATSFFFLQIAIFTLALLAHGLDKRTNDGLSISIPYAVSKAAGTALHINLIILMLLNCQSLLWAFRKTIGRFAKVGDSRTAQNLNYDSMLAFALIHMGSQWATSAQLSIRHGLGIKGFALYNFAAGVGWSGHAMVHMLTLMVLFTTLLNKMSRDWLISWGENVFSVAFLCLWAAHEAFCIPDWSLQSFVSGSDRFWMYWIAGAIVYLVERIVLGMRSKQKVISITASQGFEPLSCASTRHVS